MRVYANLHKKYFQYDIQQQKNERFIHMNYTSQQNVLLSAATKHNRRYIHVMNALSTIYTDLQ